MIVWRTEKGKMKIQRYTPPLKYIILENLNINGILFIFFPSCYAVLCVWILHHIISCDPTNNCPNQHPHQGAGKDRKGKFRGDSVEWPRRLGGVATELLRCKEEWLSTHVYFGVPPLNFAC